MSTLRSRRGRSVKSFNITALRSLRSETATVDVPASQPGEFRVFRAYEGVQLVIEWSVPSGAYDRVQIRRRLDAWPESVEDGVFIVEDSLPFSVFQYSDREVEQYRVYYYRMFIHRQEDDVWFTERRFRGKEFPLPTQYFHGALWKRFPSLYHSADGEG